MKARENKQIVNAKRWSTYAVAGAASAVGVATAEQANADSFYSGVLNQNMTAAGPSSINYTLLKTAISAGTVGVFANFWHSSGINGHAYFLALGGQVAGSNHGFLYAYNLGAAGGQVLSALGFNPANYFNTMAYHGGFTYSQFLGQGVGMVGFNFISPAEGTLHYGWARVNMTSGAPKNDMTLVDWAYSDQAGFLAGQVPEPASLGLLAVGAAGVAMWRRQRRESIAK